MYLYYVNIVNYYSNTFDDMEKEKFFFYHYNVFEYNDDFETFFKESDDAISVFVVLDNNVYLYEIEYYKYKTIYTNNFLNYNKSSSIKNLHIAKKIILNFNRNRVLNSLSLLKLLSGSFFSNNKSI